MSTQLTTATRSPSLNTTLDSSSNLAIQVLSQTEEMNNQVISEMTTMLKGFEKMLTEIQRTLNATIQENHLLKKEIIQLNTKIKENEELHTAEMKKNTQTIDILSKSVTRLTADLNLNNHNQVEQAKDFQTLVANYNSHGHTTQLRPYVNGGPFGSLGPSTLYQTKK
jgi:hypothetical protein